MSHFKAEMLPNKKVLISSSTYGVAKMLDFSKVDDVYPSELLAVEIVRRLNQEDALEYMDEVENKERIRCIVSVFSSVRTDFQTNTT